MIPLFFLFFIILSCSKDEDTINYTAREDMRQFVIGISEWSKDKHPGFIVIPQNGHDLFSKDGEPTGPAATEYLSAIDGAGQEDLFYGYDTDNQATKQEDIDWIAGFLKIGQDHGVIPLVTNYCSDSIKMVDAYKKSDDRGYISFSANHRGLDTIPTFPIFHENNNEIATLKDAKNFLYLLDTQNFTSKEEYISALDATNYDLFIIDLYYEDEQLDSSDIAKLQTKPNGARRLVVSYMSIGEAEDYRYYWKDEWKTNPPKWLGTENPDWPGNYKVQYWDKDWQNIIYGNDSSYLQKILDVHFDGVYLDLIEAFESYENN